MLHFSVKILPSKNTLKQKTKKCAKIAEKAFPVKQTKTNHAKPVSNQEPVERTNAPLNKWHLRLVTDERKPAELVKEREKLRLNGRCFWTQFWFHLRQSTLAQKTNVHLQKNLVYFLLNKPKDYITTAKDPEGRENSFRSFKGATKERIYPIGRLDRKPVCFDSY